MSPVGVAKLEISDGWQIGWSGLTSALPVKLCSRCWRNSIVTLSSAAGGDCFSSPLHAKPHPAFANVLDSWVAKEFGLVCIYIHASF